MIRKLSIPFAMAFLLGVAITGVAVTWLRNTILGTVGKPVSDRNQKSDVIPVRW